MRFTPRRLREGEHAGKQRQHLPLTRSKPDTVVQLVAVGLNHSSAPVEIREQLAFTDAELETSLQSLVGAFELGEATILATCNRSEIYAVCDTHDGSERILQFLSAGRDLDVERLRPSLYEFTDAEAADHLFRVACGIDSLVIGESQILGQVRDALEAAQRHQSARLLLNELFQRALKVGKRARTETDIGRGHLSISTAAVELASRIFDRLEGKSALLIGAGEMMTLTAQYLVDGGIGSMMVANRTPERAAELARGFAGEALSLDEFPQRMHTVDIVISSTAAPGFVLQADVVREAMARRKGLPLFLIDIAVPRDIDPAVRELDNVFLFDIDDLEQVVQANRQEREREIQKVEELIVQEHAEYTHWLNALDAGPLIREMRQRAEQLRQQELQRWTGRLAHLSAEDRATVEAVLRGYANKLLHEPSVQIKDLANADDGYLRLDTIRRVFNLDGYGAEPSDHGSERA